MWISEHLTTDCPFCVKEAYKLRKLNHYLKKKITQLIRWERRWAKSKKIYLIFSGHKDEHRRAWTEHELTPVCCWWAGWSRRLVGIVPRYPFTCTVYKSGPGQASCFTAHDHNTHNTQVSSLLPQIRKVWGECAAQKEKASLQRGSNGESEIVIGLFRACSASFGNKGLMQWPTWRTLQTWNDPATHLRRFNTDDNRDKAGKSVNKQPG